MRKDQIASLLASSTGIEEKVAQQAVTSFLDILTQAMASGMPVSFRGFGTFTVRVRQPRRVRDHYKNRTRWIGEARVPHFKPSKSLRQKIEGRE
jgi:nucleoid DNA-binding protein